MVVDLEEVFKISFCFALLALLMELIAYIVTRRITRRKARVKSGLRHRSHR